MRHKLVTNCALAICLFIASSAWSEVSPNARILDGRSYYNNLLTAAGLPLEGSVELNQAFLQSSANLPRGDQASSLDASLPTMTRLAADVCDYALNESRTISAEMSTRDLYKRFLDRAPSPEEISQADQFGPNRLYVTCIILAVSPEFIFTQGLVRNRSN